MPSKLYSLLLLLPAVVSAVNDWSTPCLNGTCSYAIHNTSHPLGVIGGALHLNATENALSDITPAAGWTLLDCHTNNTSQDIRAICTGDNSTCSHLYNNGALQTIVRLPEDCGKGPFARIVAEWHHLNQTVPDEVAQKLRKRDGQPESTVRGITFDTNWQNHNASVHGPVGMVLRGATGSASNSTEMHAHPAARSVEERDWLDDLGNAGEKFGKDVNTGFNDFLNFLGQNYQIMQEEGTSLSYSKSGNLFNKGVQCTSSTGLTLTAKVYAECLAQISAKINYGIALTGTIVPPYVANLGVILDASETTISAGLTLIATGSISMDSGLVTLLSVGVPGLDFPDILTLGPTFNINAQATASLQADAELDIQVNYNLDGASIKYPPSLGQNPYTLVSPSHATFGFWVNPKVEMMGTISAHVIPQVAFGITVLNNAASATVDANLDGFAELTLQFAQSTTNNPAGCAKITSGFSFNAGANANIFGVWKPSDTSVLYSKTWQLWQQCFNSNTPTRRAHSRDFVQPRTLPKRSFDCSGLGAGKKEEVAGGTVTPSVS